MKSPESLPLADGIHFRMRGLSLLIAIFVASAGALFATITEPDNHEVVFRYRTFSGTRPGTVSALTSAGGIDFSSGSSDIASIARGSGFDTWIVTDFDGTSEYLQGASSISTVDAAGNDSFTVEAWFSPTSTTLGRYTSLFSTTGGGRGFALRLVSGRLQGSVRFVNGSSIVTETVDQGSTYPNLTAGNWYYAVLHCRKQATFYQLRLELDGVEVAYVETPLWNGVAQSTVLPMVAGDTLNGTGVDLFGGRIYAVVVSNHDLYLANYVQNEVVRDGCRYFGTASYHDYLDTTAGVDYRMQRTMGNFPDLSSKVTEKMQLPLMNDGYVPQGLGYDAATDNFYVGMYWMDVDGSIASATNHPEKISLVAEINKSTHALKRVFQLYTATGAPSYGHTDAIEFYNGSLYVSYGSSIYRYRLSDAPNPTYVFDANTFANPLLDQNPLTIVTSYSLVNYLQGNDGTAAMNLFPDSNGDMILWSADYDTANYKKVLGFKLNSDGSIQRPAVYAFNLPILDLNGVACYSATSTDLWFYMEHGGTFEKVHYSKSSPNAVSDTVVAQLPGGTEDLTLVGSQIWSTNETGASSYQKRTTRSSWMDDLYPFLFGLNLP